MQRLFDLVFAALALLVLSPVLLPVMLVLRLTGEGEIFYVQQRVGKNGKPFGVFKFATMLKNSPSLGTGTVTVKDDPRVLPVGRFLRKSKINELPQLINILNGSMSIIGPRPQTPRCFSAFPEEFQNSIVRVTPGLSGVGSVVFRDEENMMDAANDPDRFYDQVIMPYKGALEQWYVEHRNLGSYFGCIFLTVWVVLTGKITAAYSLFRSLPPPPPELHHHLGWDFSGGPREDAAKPSAAARR